MVTPFKGPDGAEVDYEAAAELATWLVDQGCDGILVNGTTGESPTTSDEEKAELVRRVVAAVGDRAAVLAGAGSNHTGHAAKMAAAAAEAGADGILVVTPYYSRPSQAGVIKHIVTVAEAGGLPTMIYDVPGRTGVRVSADAYQEMAKHPLIVATKDATGDVGAAPVLSEKTGLIWYSGDDLLLLPFLAFGGAGVISVATHAVARQIAEVVAAWDSGDHGKALSIFRKAIPVIQAVNGAGMQAVMAKAASELLGTIPNREVRAPLMTADEAEVAAVREALVNDGLISK
jgi:4-hydroxy-tetrahydrodipicolinate synthase